MIASGRDAWGPFHVFRDETVTCQLCGEPTHLFVEYTRKPDIAMWGIAKIDESKLIIRRKDGKLIRKIGLTCGCYARAHSQYAHLFAEALNESLERAKPTKVPAPVPLRLRFPLGRHTGAGL